ncbi:MAG: dihydroorotate dehydrogenase electron transfer subunit [Thermoproteales archaeon]|nr:dihydroorotate dehydrogenase electron transfer subunit [Thermoproteales archaeon]
MYLRARVREVRQLCEGVREYVLELPSELRSSPGQYVMVWVPRVGEIPISVAGEEGRELRLVIARKGRVTSYIHEHVTEGSQLFIRGPLGKGFTLRRGAALLVAGGYGAAPLLHLASALAKVGAHVVVALGFRDKERSMLVREFEEVADEVVVATEDGSLGYRGLVTDLAFRIMAESRYDVIYTCGKEQMMAKVVRRALEAGVEVQASLERLIKCGIGVCGSCALEPLGLRVCVDGPVFDGRVLVQLEDFGRWWRDAAGRRVPIPP